MAFENFKNVQELIKFIDQKAGALLVLYGFLLTAFIEFSKKLKFIELNNVNETFDIILSFVTLFVGIALVLLIMYQFYIIIILILKPRGAQNYSAGQLSLFYYKHIAQMGKQTFVDQFTYLNEDELIEALLEQVFEISGILEQKTINLAKTTSYLLLTGILLLFFILLSYTV